MILFSGALEASRAWGTGLNRLGWGFIAVFLMSWGFGLDAVFSFPVLGDQSLNARLLAATILLLLLSGLAGSMVITLGSVTDIGKWTLKHRTILAEKVGRMNNGLLVQLYGDAALRYEMAAAARGTMYFALICVLVKLFSQPTLLSVDLNVGGASWPAIAGAMFALVFNWLLNRTVEDAFEAIDAVVKNADVMQSSETKA